MRGTARALAAHLLLIPQPRQSNPPVPFSTPPPTALARPVSRPSYSLPTMGDTGEVSGSTSQRVQHEREERGDLLAELPFVPFRPLVLTPRLAVPCTVPRLLPG